MRVLPLVPEKEREWDDFVLQSGNGTLFHMTGWKRVVEKTFGFESRYLYATDGNRIQGVLPLFRAPVLPFGESLVSVPYGVYGGYCSVDEETSDSLFEAAAGVLAETGGKFLELRHVKATGDRLQRKDLYVTFRRPIFDTEEANMAAIPRKERAEIRKGKKNNLVSQWEGEEALDPFYSIYAYSVRNLGSPVFPKALFRNLLSEFGDRCGILTVRHGNRRVAGVMTFFFKDQVMPYYGGGLKECFSLAVNDFMYWELLCHGLAKGYKVFDFGRSKKGTGSYKFKEHWGFVPEPLEYQYYLPNGGKMPNISPSNPKYSLAISLWKKIPLPVTMRIGPFLSRYFS